MAQFQVEPGSEWASEPPRLDGSNGFGTSLWPMMCRRSMGMSARRAM